MILFTADWHLKLGQKSIPKAWALNRYRLFFEQVHAIKCDKHIIGGDLFDRSPTLEELELYFYFIAGVTVPTIIFDGNHEATRKNKTFLSQLIKVSSKINPLVKVIDSSLSEKNFSILPYAELHKKNSIEQLDSSKPLFTHVRGEIPPHVKSEVDLNRFENFPVVFAGDLHAHSNCQKNIVYPGSPLTTSFHRSKVKTGYILIDESNNWIWNWYEFKLPQLIRKTVNAPKEMIPTEYHHTIYELEGDIEQLAGVKNTDLLDKKVIKRSSEAALILTPEMSLLDELAEYLLYILELPEETVSTIIGVFHDYSKDT